MKTFHAYFETQVIKTPKATAIQCGTRSISYQTLNACANRLAIQLIQAGAKPDMCIALCLPRSIEQIIGILGVLKAGSAYVPLDPAQPRERLQLVLQDCEAPILVSNLENKYIFPTFTGIIINLESMNNRILSPTDLEILEAARDTMSSHNLAYVIYTSGSTGTPKGVMIEHHSLIHYCQWFRSYSGISSSHCIDYSSNYIFDFGITSSLAPLLLGARLIICSDEVKLDPYSYLKHLESTKINLINITPSFFKALIHITQTEHQFTLPDLQSIILGGENLLTADCSAWLSRFKHHVIHNEYGPTETTVAIIQHTVTFENIENTSLSIPIGKPGPNTQTFILNTDLKTVKQGEIGELYVSGTCLARGYINQDQLTAKSFIQYSQEPNQPTFRVYKTGDLCKLNSNHDIEYIGRIDKQIKIRGYRIEPQEIETQLRNHANIQDAKVVLRDSINNEPLLVAYYILKTPEQALSYAHLHDYLKNFLPDFMIPNAFVQLEYFPRTNNDKLDERALPEPNLQSSKQYQAPRTPLEQTITRIWEEEIQQPHIGMNDNFFELGGHSLMVARIIMKIAQQIGKKINLSALYRAPTIEQFAKIVEQAPLAESSYSHMTPTKNYIPSLPLHDLQLILWLSKFGKPKIKGNNIVWRKRLQGPIDKTAMDLALEWVLQKQEVFSYHIHTLYPLQTPCTQPAKQFRKWRNTSLTHLTEEEAESFLAQNFDDLFYRKIWRFKSIWISAELYYLHHDQVELQVCLSHLLVDESCASIFFQTLSHAYLYFTKRTQTHSNHAMQPYAKYIAQHNATMRQQADTAATFWADYLKNAGSFHFPNQYVMPNKEAASTQLALNPEFLIKLRQFCARQAVAINDVLCAAVSLALLQCCDNDLRCVPHKIVIFTFKSTRDDPEYDNTIGCFLRVDPIKLALNNQSTLSGLAKQAQHSATISAPFQHASILVKYASVGKLLSCLSQNPIQRFVIRVALAFLAKNFPVLKLDRNVFHACEIMAAVDQTKQFLINVNMPREFLDETTENVQPTLFGIPELPIPYHPFRNTLIKYVLDVYFHRGEDRKNYIVITSNHTPDFQKRLGEAVASIIENYSE